MPARVPSPAAVLIELLRTGLRQRLLRLVHPGEPARTVDVPEVRLHLADAGKRNQGRGIRYPAITNSGSDPGRHHPRQPPPDDLLEVS